MLALPGRHAGSRAPVNPRGRSRNGRGGIAKVVIAPFDRRHLCQGHLQGRQLDCATAAPDSAWSLVAYIRGHPCTGGPQRRAIR